MDEDARTCEATGLRARNSLGEGTVLGSRFACADNQVIAEIGHDPRAATLVPFTHEE